MYTIIYSHFSIIEFSLDESTNEFCVFLECCSEPDVVGFDCKFRSSIMNSSFSDSLNILKNKWNRTDGASGYYKNWKTGSNCFKREGGELMGNSLGMCLMTSFGLMEKKDQLYPDGKLHIKFTIYEINIFASALATSEKSSFNYLIESDKVFDIMTSSLNSDEVVIKANDGVIVKAFKSLLCEKSTVFRDLITKDLSESAGITVDIIEFNGQVIQELLRFIYFGNVHNIKQVDMELLRAAKFYDILGLQKMCMESLVEKIHDDDLIHVVKFSDIYDLDELFEHCCKKLEWYVINLTYYYI